MSQLEACHSWRHVTAGGVSQLEACHSWRRVTAGGVSQLEACLGKLFLVFNNKICYSCICLMNIGVGGGGGGGLEKWGVFAVSHLV